MNPFAEKPRGLGSDVQDPKETVVLARKVKRLSTESAIQPESDVRSNMEK